MKKLKLVYNPNSGDKTFKSNLDLCILELQSNGYDVHVFRSIVYGDILDHFSNLDINYDTIVACGGDGTLNLVVNAMFKNNIKAKFAIIPSGTANDFARFLNIPTNPVDACKLITAGKTILADIGQANDTYFINVCCAGLFTNISSQVDVTVKDTLGNLAYYLKALEQMTNIIPFTIQIENSVETIVEDVYLFLVLNSCGAGSFSKLCPEASITDGYLDFIALKANSARELARLFVKILKGEHLEDDSIVYFTDKYIKITNLTKTSNEAFNTTDIDGEDGPDLPVEINILEAALEIFTL